MARLHMRFRNINRRAVKAAQMLFDAGAWTGSPEEQQDKFESFLRRVSEVYGVPQPTLTVTTESDVFGLVAPNTIVLPKFSVISLFNSFRAHMQYAGACDGVEFLDNRDAQAWACSLFYTCRPIAFRKAVRNRTIAGVFPDDLLSSATLASRQEEVDEVFSGMVADNFSDEEIDNEDGLDDEVQESLPEPQEDGTVELLTVDQAAQRLGVSQSTVRNMLRDGRLPETRRGRRVYIEFGVEAPAQEG